MSSSLKVESVVVARYSAAAQQRVQSLCCPVEYDRRYLEVIPAEILERDYGCGDPSRHLRAGETVLDLGSGAGKICFIASQVVGPTGRVIGVELNEEMLRLARRHQQAVGDAIGWHNVEFRRGRIQDLALDLDRLEETLRSQSSLGADPQLAAEHIAGELRTRAPLVPNESVDVVVSSCVLNLVDAAGKAQLFREIYRVLRRGGRAVISDIVSNEAVPVELQQDPDLWSGCISGALTEEGFLRAFAEAGFEGTRILSLEVAPWRVVGGLEFRSMTVEALKGEFDGGSGRGQTVIYKGPFQEVVDEEGHRFVRGRRIPVDAETSRLLRRSAYGDQFVFFEPPRSVSDKEALARDDSLAREPRPGHDAADRNATSSRCCRDSESCG